MGGKKMEKGKKGKVEEWIGGMMGCCARRIRCGSEMFKCSYQETGFSYSDPS